MDVLSFRPDQFPPANLYAATAATMAVVTARAQPGM